MGRSINVCAAHFWPGFSLQVGFVRYLLNQALGPFVVVASETEADIVVSSIFPKRPRMRKMLGVTWPRHPEKTISFIWENQRPDYERCRFSISSDFDSYGGRNFRVPLWYMQLQWPGLERDQPASGSQAWSSFEPLVRIESLLASRPISTDRPGFCCFVAANREPHRMFAVERLSTIESVDLFGPIAGKPFQGSKYQILSQYRFNLCFENSTFPGYYTEKLLQSWVGGCVPLYYSDKWFVRDFNPRAAINRNDFASLEQFVEYVAAVNASPSKFDELLSAPLLVERPTIDPAVNFLREACETILHS
jgi:alpha(1,3/1,4) fucosyltransferase